MNGEGVATARTKEMIEGGWPAIARPHKHENGVAEILPQRRLSLMARLNNKREVTNGTLFLIGIIPAFLMLCLSYGTTMMGWVREDQTQTTEIQSIKANIDRMTELIKADTARTSESVDRLDKKFEKLDDRLREQERFIDKTTGFKAGVAETQSDKGK